MDMNDILKLGAEMFRKSELSGDAGSNLDINSIASALTGLTGGGRRGLDLHSLISHFSSGGLEDVVKSWLGDGENERISPEHVKNILGHDKISEFASRLGISHEEAAGGLADALPHMVDRASSGGSLLDSLGGVRGILGLVSRLLGR